MPPKLSKPAIVDAALVLLNRDGLDGIRLRALATELGVQAPAIYWHFRDKQDVLDEMATEIWRRVATEIDTMPADQPWQDDVRGFARIERRWLLAYRDGAKAFSGTYLTDASLLTRQEASLARWELHGFDTASAVQAFALVHSFTVGFCIEEQAVSQTQDDRYALDARAARLSDADAPHVVASGPAIFADPQHRFDAAIELLVQTIGTLRRERPGSTALS